jgi:hypothetical protein
MPTAKPHVLLEMSDEPDCRFVADWLVRADEAEKAWTNALDDPCFRERTLLLTADGMPNLAASALEIFGELEHRCHVTVLELYPEGDFLLNREFAFLVQLGFFVDTGESYKMTVPAKMTPTMVKDAALALLLTLGVGEDGIGTIQPERLLHTYSATEAEARRSRLMAVRRFEADVPRGITIQ